MYFHRVVVSGILGWMYTDCMKLLECAVIESDRNCVFRRMGGEGWDEVISVCKKDLPRGTILADEVYVF